jgi:hypothetical protein
MDLSFVDKATRKSLVGESIRDLGVKSSTVLSGPSLWTSGAERPVRLHSVTYAIPGRVMSRITSTGLSLAAVDRSARIRQDTSIQFS